VIGEIFFKRKMIVVPMIYVSEGTRISDDESCELVFHDAHPLEMATCSRTSFLIGALQP
jgi:hypothetical protein